ncbi:type IV toxin-antitoxin system AbiEi family antitoxin [Psychroserpens sp. Hel_I_66]|uniref:type IV toxin-antitoxin system AbiEi family antitoxin n=1 Tax=Psychroserpens sp. Hel_I_66 TaxID=1250004 RepID=UPI000647A384|nr:type IV toxin-antitoxin system AbiEi family antitoxin [Psychroserpens sp. Hel_I_66]
MDFVYIIEWFDKLDFKIDVIYQNYDKEKGESVYLLNDEPVYIETKNEVRPQNINIFEKSRSKNLPVLVASKYITPKSKKIFREKHINYIDSFGNAYIDLKNLKVYIEQGNAKPYNSEYSNIFTQSGGQILFHLLKNPELINETQRHLAHISDVSLGSVSKFLKGLFDEGYSVKWKNEQKYQLVNKEALLEKWIVILNEKILPAHKIGNFTFSKTNNENWKNQLMYPNVLWSGEPAAALVTEYLNPEKFSMFTRLPKSEIIKDLKLLPDPKGEISIYKPFWLENNTMDRLINYMNNQNAVHPLIIYAQLIYSGNSRNIETAQLIYDEHIKPNI